MARDRAVLEVDGKEYTLEFDRNSIIYTEEIIGFAVRDFDKQPHTQSYKLFSGGLQKNHAELSLEERVDLFDDYAKDGGDTAEVLGFLLDAYQNFSQTTQKPTKQLKRI